jgi:hypothetical protein
MTEKLDPEVKRLHRLSAGELSDEVGTIKAEIADCEAKLEALKAEAVRRQLTEADGRLFRVTLSAPTTGSRIDTSLLRKVMGDAFVDHFSKLTEIGWSLRCFARKAA